MNDGTMVKGEEKLLWWQVKGLSYTASGYGSKIPTRWMVTVNGRKYRVYCSVYSNIGTCYIKRKGYTFDQNIVG
jgi:mRNA-degrading endonuclease HigB of HigAB toxin-antitoxin module